MNNAIAVENPSFKEKLRNWYIKNIANNGASFERVNDIQTTVDNTAGAVAVGIFAPAFSPLIPIVQKGYKAMRKFKYNLGKKIIHKGLDIKDEDLNVKPTNEVLDSFSNEEIESTTKTMSEYIMKKHSKEGVSK